MAEEEAVGEDQGSTGVGEEEGAEWLEAWLEVETEEASAAGEKEGSPSGANAGAYHHHQPKVLFNPCKVRQAAG